MTAEKARLILKGGGFGETPRVRRVGETEWRAPGDVAIVSDAWTIAAMILLARLVRRIAEGQRAQIAAIAFD